MQLSVENPEAYRLAQTLAAQAGESLEQAVLNALRERLDRIQSQPTRRATAEELSEIGRRCAALPDLDTRTPDEILGYDEMGGFG